MTIKKKSEMKRDKIEIDLTGPDGNAYVLLSIASRLAKQLDLPYAEIREEMTSSDYENLLQVFDSYFGSFVTLYR